MGDPDLGVCVRQDPERFEIDVACVVELTSEFTPGGMVKKGDLVLRIDEADFENALSISQSELDQAEASITTVQRFVLEIGAHSRIFT